METNRTVTKNDFSRGPVWKNIIKQAVPLTIAQLIQLLYNVVDRVYIGHMEEGNGLALTGIGLTFPLAFKNIRICKQISFDIVKLGMSHFVMQGTSCIVQVACNTTLQSYGGDLYVGIMTVANSIREIFALPVSGMINGAQPVISYNCGAIDVATAEGWVWREGRIYGRADF